MGKRTRFRGVTALGGGMYDVRAWYVDPKTDRQREIRRTIKASSAADANAQRLEMAEAAAARRLAPEPERLRLRDFVDSWLKQRAPHLKPSTRSTYADTIGNRIIPAIGDYFVDRITSADVIELVAKWSRVERRPGEVYSRDSVNGWIRVLKTVMRAAKRADVVLEIRALPRPVDAHEALEDEGRGLSLDELRAFLRVGPTVDSVRAWWPLLATMAWTGLRFGEVTALEWRDLDDQAGVLRVRRAQWRGIVGHPKAKASVRAVAITDELRDALRAHRAALIAEQHPLLARGLMFPTGVRKDGELRSASGYVSNAGVGKAVLRACAAAKIDLGDRPWVHCLRHTFNNFLRQVTTEIVRQALVGHADEEIGKVYSSVGLEEKRAAVGSLVRLVRGT